jgi:tripartite-type tricarboxylate transporter receptor subunit TctC
MRPIRNPVCLTINLLLALTFQSGSVLANEHWPTKQTLKIVVPYAAGSNGDAVGRVVASYLGVALKGSTIVIENRPGIGGILGTRSFAKSPPDGYTLCVCSGGPITVPSIVEKMYDPLVDLAPSSRINTSPLVLIVNTTSPLKSTRMSWHGARQSPAGSIMAPAALAG